MTIKKSLMTIFIAIKLLVTLKTIPYSIHIEKNNQEQYSIIRKI